jgi:hypothetical protein
MCMGPYHQANLLAPTAGFLLAGLLLRVRAR